MIAGSERTRVGQLRVRDQLQEVEPGHHPHHALRRRNGQRCLPGFVDLGSILLNFDFFVF